MTIRTWTLAERPELEEQMRELGSVGLPEFILNDLAAGLYFDHLAAAYAAYVVLACDSEHPDTLLARGLSVPFAMGFGRRTELPSAGWDGILAWAHRDMIDGRAPAHVSALEINVRESARGSGVSAVVLNAMKANARAITGVSELVAPLRPNHKHLEPRVALNEYVARLREDGLPADPWLRVHVRLGAEVVSVCPVSMAITGLWPSGGPGPACRSIATATSR